MSGKAKKQFAPANATTSQSLHALLKSAREVMRKDKGLTGDLHRLPIVTWIMFLKFLDDLGLHREDEGKLAGSKLNAPLRELFCLARETPFAVMEPAIDFVCRSNHG